MVLIFLHTYIRRTNFCNSSKYLAHYSQSSYIYFKIHFINDFVQSFRDPCHIFHGDICLKKWYIRSC